jgi:hypothetical protein
MQEQTTLKFNDVPIINWLVGLAFLGTGLYIYSIRGLSGNSILAGAIGLAFLLLNRGLVITADRGRRVLRLHYWSLILLRTTREIPFNEIAALRVNSSRTMERSTQYTRSYRIEVVRRDNTILPFRGSYSGGAFRKQAIVDQLRAFIGLGENFDESPVGLLREVVKTGALESAHIQEGLTGPNAQERVTKGVHWQLQSHAMGASPITRWFSPDFKTNEGFLLAAQKVAGQSGGGIMASLGKMLLPQTIALYGFKPADTPNLGQADLLTPLPALVDQHFTVFTSTPVEARRILNPWVQNPLAEWGQRHPLKQVQTGEGPSQLIVLFSPNGVYLVTLGNLQPDHLEELTDIGVEMVKSQ